MCNRKMNSVILTRVQRIMDIHGKSNCLKPPWEQPLYLAAKNGHADVLDVLFDRGSCDFDVFSDNETPLHVAVKEQHKNVVEVILKHSCSISTKLTKDEQKLWKTYTNSTVARDSMSV